MEPKVAPFFILGCRSLLHKAQINKYMNEQLIIDQYVNYNKTIRDISIEFEISSKKISKLLTLNHIPKKRKNNNSNRILSSTTKNKISKSLKSRTTPRKGSKMSLSKRFVNIRAQLKLDRSIDLSKYEDIDKLLEITKHLIRIPKCKKNQDFIISFISKFYKDQKFNEIYDFWKNNGNNKWAKPSLDHIVPSSKGGDWNLENLQFMTWFENRCKCDMNMEEWNNFKEITQTKSNYFI